LSQEIFRLLLQAIIADPDSTPLFVSCYEKGFSIFIAYFAFHSAHFSHSPIYVFSRELLFCLISAFFMVCEVHFDPLSKPYSVGHVVDRYSNKDPYPAFSIYKIFPSYNQTHERHLSIIKYKKLDVYIYATSEQKLTIEKT